MENFKCMLDMFTVLWKLKKKGRRSSYTIASFIQTITIYSNKSAHWVIIQGNLWNSGKTGIYKGSIVVYGF